MPQQTVDKENHCSPFGSVVSSNTSPPPFPPSLKSASMGMVSYDDLSEDDEDEDDDNDKSYDEGDLDACNFDELDSDLVSGPSGSGATSISVAQYLHLAVPGKPQRSAPNHHGHQQRSRPRGGQSSRSSETSGHGTTANGTVRRSKFASKRGWTPDEDRILSNLVSIHGVQSWSVVASELGCRSGKQCRERWLNHLSPNVVKGEWTQEEDEAILRRQAEIGNRWADIARDACPGRSDNAVKNRWHAVVKARARLEATGGLDPSPPKASSLSSSTSSSLSSTSSIGAGAAPDPRGGAFVKKGRREEPHGARAAAFARPSHFSHEDMITSPILARRGRVSDQSLGAVSTPDGRVLRQQGKGPRAERDDEEIAGVSISPATSTPISDPALAMWVVDALGGASAGKNGTPRQGEVEGDDHIMMLTASPLMPLTPYRIEGGKDSTPTTTAAEWSNVNFLDMMRTLTL